jgi:hypothetical protein
MKFQKAIILASLLISTGIAAPYTVPQSNRSKSVFNTQWKYYSGTPTGTPQASTFNDSSWQSVNLPHCFNIPWAVNQHIDFGGTGWYRKHFSLTQAASGRKILVEFEGVFLHSLVYLNGTLVGEHKGGFTSFICDITSQVKLDGTDNVLAVSVSSNFDAQIAPRAGDFVFIGGIYRDVYLVETDPVHVTYYGTYVTTPFGGNLVSSSYNLPTSYTSAPVRMKTEVQNQGSASATCVVVNTIVDASNQIVATMQDNATIAANATTTVTQNTTVTSPHFWSPDSPYLYKVYTEIQVNGTVVDLYQTPLGIRWMQFTSTNGYYINGSHLFLRGFDVHQDHAGWATAVTNAGHARDVAICKSVGTRFFRGCHYPKDPAFVKACDSIGVCLMLEICYWGRGGGSGQDASPASGSADFTPFSNNCVMQMQEMVRTFRNDPSVILYSLGNEPTGGVLQGSVLRAAALSQDSSRAICHVTGFYSGSFAGDVEGWNGAAPDAGMCGQSHPMLATELWDVAEVNRPGAYSALADNISACPLGAAHWTAFDYGTHENWTLNMVGMCDNNRIPKRRYYYLRNQWLGTAAPAWPAAGTATALQLTADKTTILNDGTDDCMLTVKVVNSSNTQISNNVSVTLSVPAGAGVFPSTAGNTITLNTPDGINGIEMRSYASASTITVTAASTGLTSGTLPIQVINSTPIVTAVRPKGPAFAAFSPAAPRVALHSEIRGGKRVLAWTISSAAPIARDATMSLYNLDGRKIASVKITGNAGSISLGSDLTIVSRSVVVYRFKNGAMSTRGTCLLEK